MYCFDRQHTSLSTVGRILGETRAYHSLIEYVDFILTLILLTVKGIHSLSSSTVDLVSEHLNFISELTDMDLLLFSLPDFELLLNKGLV
jgi:hypothetical protein